MIPSAILNMLMRHTLRCKEATEWISRDMERPLSLIQQLQLRVHMIMCLLCKRYAQQLRFLRRAMRDQREFWPGATLSSEARERLVRALKSAS